MNNLRQTLVVPNRYAWHNLRTQAALDESQGLQILMIGQLAARLAGGFLEPIDSDTLKGAVSECLAGKKKLGELDEIKNLPGFRRAAAASLGKAWEAGIKLEGKERLGSMRDLEAEVLKFVPKHQLRAPELVAMALKRIDKAENIFGSLEIRGFTEMSPIWRPLLEALNKKIEVTWVAEARAYPPWLKSMGIKIKESDPERPVVRALSCANPHHEILEALRWSRKLLAQGIPAYQIAITSASLETWDDYVLSMRKSTGLPIAFVQGMPAVATKEGQLTSALADILLRGFTRTRLIRLISLLKFCTKRFASLSSNWSAALPNGLPMLDAERVENILSMVDSKKDFKGGDPVPTLKLLVAQLQRDLENAGDIGEKLLEGKALGIWRKALSEGSAEGLNETLTSLRVKDNVDAGTAIVWAPASAVAAFPRPYTWAVGLTSQSWPRRAAEDPLIPNHIVPSLELTPLPIHQADQRDFDTLSKMTKKEFICSRARRESEGRLCGISILFPSNVTPEFLTLSQEPEHAASDTDRLMARPGEFSKLPSAITAEKTWTNWHKKEITEHDGKIRKNHPLLLHALDRTHSSKSLNKLLRDPLGYLWEYGFNWKEPSETEPSLTLSALETGNLLHQVLEEVVHQLEETGKGGFGKADSKTIEKAIKVAIRKTRKEWEENQSTPPLFLWELQLEATAEMASTALLFPSESLVKQSSWTEIRFGGISKYGVAKLKPKTGPPWDPDKDVVIPNTKIKISGYIDRLDLSGDKLTARVIDYKSGKPIKKDAQLAGGTELQRTLYAFAVKLLIPKIKTIDAALLYTKNNAKSLSLEDPDESMKKLGEYIQAAIKAFTSGNVHPGEGINDHSYPFRLAMPAGATEKYMEIKNKSFNAALADLAPLWSEI